MERDGTYCNHCEDLPNENHGRMLRHISSNFNIASNYICVVFVSYPPLSAVSLQITWYVCFQLNFGVRNVHMPFIVPT